MAGPIERARNLIPQLQVNNNKFNYKRAASGLRLIGWGLIKKIVIADRLALFVNEVYNTPEDYRGIPLIVATLFFAFQIYCDFSGYSDMAIGTARILGYDFVKNFDNPYISKSVAEFWRRWHISLSTWFKDYVYIPLGGNRVAKWRNFYNLFIVFILSGIWHGASWNFVIWGFLHVFYIACAMWFKSVTGKFEFREKFKSLKVFSVINTIWVFVLVNLAWVFFRANDLHDSLYILNNMHIDIFEQINMILSNENLARGKYLYLGQNIFQFSVAILSIVTLTLIENLSKGKPIEDFLVGLNPFWRWVMYYIAIISIIALGVFEKNQFIYFQF